MLGRHPALLNMSLSLPPGPVVLTEVVPVPPGLAEGMRTGQGTGPSGLPPGVKKMLTQVWLLDATAGARTGLVGHIDHGKTTLTASF